MAIQECVDLVQSSLDGWCNCRPCSMVCHLASSLSVSSWHLAGIYKNTKRIKRWLYAHRTDETQQWAKRQNQRQTCNRVESEQKLAVDTIFQGIVLPIPTRHCDTLCMYPWVLGWKENQNPRNPHHSGTHSQHRHPSAWSSWMRFHAKPRLCL